MPYLMAPLTNADGKLAGYAYISSRLTASTEGGGTAVREKRPVWNQDFINDPLAAPWHAGAARFGWGSVAALPLHRGGKVIGAFNLYAGEKDAFDAEARKLLEEMATDISYALDGYERNASIRLTG